MNKFKFSIIYIIIASILVFFCGAMAKVLEICLSSVIIDSLSIDTIAILQGMGFLGVVVIWAICILLISIFFVNYIKIIKDIK